MTIPRWFPFVSRTEYDRLRTALHAHHDVGTMHKACGIASQAHHWGKRCPVCTGAPSTGSRP